MWGQKPVSYTHLVDGKHVALAQKLASVEEKVPPLGTLGVNAYAYPYKMCIRDSRVGTRQRGIFSFSEREYPPYTPKRKDEGSPPRPPTLQVLSLIHIWG